MRRGWMIVCGFLVVLAGVSIFVLREEGRSTSGERTPRELESAATPPDANGVGAQARSGIHENFASADDRLADIERALVAARAEEDDATVALRQAEHELDDLEREIEAVDAFIEDLMERGEDPARHAEEGMKRLDPIIERYEARLKVVEAADVRVSAAKMHVEAIESEFESLTR